MFRMLFEILWTTLHFIQPEYFRFIDVYNRDVHRVQYIHLIALNCGEAVTISALAIIIMSSSSVIGSRSLILCLNRS